jgi:hypothetical protein
MNKLMVLMLAAWLAFAGMCELRRVGARVALGMQCRIEAAAQALDGRHGRTACDYVREYERDRGAWR